MESPSAYVTEWVSQSHFCLALCSFRPPSHALVVITWRGVGCRHMMQYGSTVKWAQLLKSKVEVSSIWDNRISWMIVCVLSTLLLLLLGGKEVMVYYYYDSYYYISHLQYCTSINWNYLETNMLVSWVG